jgi:hypothetical protein
MSLTAELTPASVIALSPTQSRSRRRRSRKALVSSPLTAGMGHRGCSPCRRAGGSSDLGASDRS